MDLELKSKKILSFFNMVCNEIAYLEQFGSAFTPDKIKDSLFRVRSINDALKEELDIIEDRIQAELRAIQEIQSA